MMQYDLDALIGVLDDLEPQFARFERTHSLHSADKSCQNPLSSANTTDAYRATASHAQEELQETCTELDAHIQALKRVVALYEADLGSPGLDQGFRRYLAIASEICDEGALVLLSLGAWFRTYGRDGGRGSVGWARRFQRAVRLETPANRQMLRMSVGAYCRWVRVEAGRMGEMPTWG